MRCKFLSSSEPEGRANGGGAGDSKGALRSAAFGCLRLTANRAVAR